MQLVSVAATAFVEQAAPELPLMVQSVIVAGTEVPHPARSRAARDRAVVKRRGAGVYTERVASCR